MSNHFVTALVPVLAVICLGELSQLPAQVARAVPQAVGKSSDGKTTSVVGGLPPGVLARMGTVRLRRGETVIYSVAFSPDGKTLATGSGSDVRLWETATGKEIRTLAGEQRVVLSVAFSPDGMTLASGSTDRAIRLWETASGKEIRKLAEHRGYVYSVAFSPDGKTLASASGDNTFRLWDISKGEEIRTLDGQASSVRSFVAFSPDGKILAAGNEDKTIRLWDTASGKEIRTLAGHKGGVYSVAFSPDGKTLASGGEDKSILWEIATGQEIFKVAADKGFAFSVAISPDGRTLASGSYDTTIRLWDVFGGKEIRSLSGHQDYVNSVAFAPNGKTLASGSHDSTALIWDMSGIVEAKRQPADLSRKALEALWSELGGDDVRKAYRALGTMTQAPKEIVPFLTEQLRPAAPADPLRVKQLLGVLDNDEFQVRQKAEQELEKLGDLATSAYRVALAGKPSAEARQRVERLLAKADDPTGSPERLRALRAVQVLEQIGSAEARQLLETLSKGAAAAGLTEQAKASLERLARRAALP
jgi:WD domain, G-beta repeat